VASFATEEITRELSSSALPVPVMAARTCGVAVLPESNVEPTASTTSFGST